MNSFIWLLSYIPQEFISEVPKVFSGLHCSCNGIKDLPGGLLVLWADGANLNEGLYGLSIFTLKHHLKLFPAFLGGVLCICINVKGFQEVVNRISVKVCPLIGLIGCGKGEFRGLPAWGVAASEYHLLCFVPDGGLL